jgi:hypothetical protein
VGTEVFRAAVERKLISPPVQPSHHLDQLQKSPFIVALKSPVPIISRHVLLHPCTRQVLLSMDPFTLVSGCMSVVGLSSNVLKLPEAYIHAAKQRNHEFQQLYQDFQNMAQILRSLQSACARAKDLE